MYNLHTDILQICRTCMKEIIDTSFYYLDYTPSANTQLTIRQTLYTCIPGLDLNIVPNTVMCSKCVDNLLSVFEFKKNCLESEIQINKYIQYVQHTGDLNFVEVVRFHEADIKNLDIEIKTDPFDITENLNNEDLVCDTSAFNEASECIESFLQPDKNLHITVKIEDLEITENFKNEEYECTEPKYLLELQKVDMQDVIFNTLDDYNIYCNLSPAEENLNTHKSNIGQNCLLEAFERENYCSKNLIKTNAYYQCYRCGHKTESKLKLILHLKHHTRKNFYHEEINSRRLSGYKKLFCYLRCSLCNYLTKYKCLFDFHIRIHYLVKKNCNHVFKLTNVYTKVFHPTTKVNKPNIKGNNRKLVKNCNNYYDSFKSRTKSKISKQHLSHRNSLKLNMRAHKVEKLSKCTICEYQCNTKVDLKRHMQLHTGYKPFSCSVCEYQCTQKTNLKKHMLIYAGEKPFSCSVCKYQCSRKGDLKSHMLTHTGDKSFTCSVCDCQFRKKSHLKQHILIHTGDKQFSCSVCEYQCNHKSSLKTHMLIHTREKPFSCSVCEYQSRNKSNLKTHMLTHTGNKPFTCSVCKYQFSRKSLLKQHILIHTGEKPFSCSVCEYQCSEKGKLKKHMLIHTGDKPFSCSVCEYYCSQKSDLKRHMLIHTREKPFSCYLCEYRFSQKGNLKRHMQIHT